MTHAPAPHGLPDPELRPEFYEGVVLKRAIAGGIDLLLIGATTLLIGLVTLVGLFFMPLIFLVLSFLYRTVTVAGGGTWGMRLVGIEIRGPDGHRLSPMQAAIHTGAYLMSVAFVLPMLLGWALMMLTARGQGLHDLLLGSTAIQRPS